jgi:hypothetical protein
MEREKMTLKTHKTVGNMRHVIAIDPGILYLAVARFQSGRLAAGIRLNAVPTGGYAPGTALGLRLVRWLADADSSAVPVLVETPEDYPGRSLATLVSMRDTIADAEKLAPRAWTKTKPARWKAQVPKPVHHTRILEILDPGEIEIARSLRALPTQGDYDHDLCDAVGLGLWAVGRLGRGGVRS